MEDICIETERLILKVVVEKYANRVVDFYLNNSEFLSRWEPKRESEFFTIQFQEQQLSEELERIQTGKLFKVYIFKKGDREFNEIIGSIALNEIVRGCFQSCFIGYKISENNTNNGFMSEAIDKLVEYAFNILNLHRIEANIMPNNLASIRVVEKNGFINEGLSRKYLRINGVWEDHIHMVILNENM